MFDLEDELRDIGLEAFKGHEDLVHSFTFRYNPANMCSYVEVTLHSGCNISELITDVTGVYLTRCGIFSPTVNTLKKVSKDFYIYKNMVIT